MTPAAWITFGIIAGFVWGGFLVLLVVAMGKERGKRSDGPGGAGAP